MSTPKAPLANNNTIAFSVDVESTYSGAEAGVFQYLELFNSLGIKATFFVVGEVGERHPGIVDAINDEGHELACHGWRHPNIGEAKSERSCFTTELDDETLDQDLRRCLETLTRLGNKPTGFRAPWFRISSENLKVVARHFTYDSSLANGNRRSLVIPPDLIELPVSSIFPNGPMMGSSFMFGPFAKRLAQLAIDTGLAASPLLMYGHSHDPLETTARLETSPLKRFWYYNRCGTMSFTGLGLFLKKYRDSGYRFVQYRQLADVHRD